MTELSFLEAATRVTEADPQTVFQQMFEFFKKLNELSDDDLIAAYNAVTCLNAGNENMSAKTTVLLNAIYRIAKSRQQRIGVLSETGLKLAFLAGKAPLL